MAPSPRNCSTYVSPASQKAAWPSRAETNRKHVARRMQNPFSRKSFLSSAGLKITHRSRNQLDDRSPDYQEENLADWRGAERPRIAVGAIGVAWLVPQPLAR